MKKYILQTLAAAVIFTPFLDVFADPIKAGTRESAEKMAKEIDIEYFSSLAYPFDENLDIQGCIQSNINRYISNIKTQNAVKEDFINKIQGLKLEHTYKAIDIISKYWCYISAIPGQGNVLEIYAYENMRENAEVTSSGAGLGYFFLGRVAEEIMKNDKTPDKISETNLDTVVFALAHEVGHSILGHIPIRENYKYINLSDAGAKYAANTGAAAGGIWFKVTKTNPIVGAALGYGAGALLGGLYGKNPKLCDYWDLWVMHEYEADLWGLNKLLHLWKRFDQQQYEKRDEILKLYKAGQISAQEASHRFDTNTNRFKIPGFYGTSFFEYQKHYNYDAVYKSCEEASKKHKFSIENLLFVSKQNPHPSRDMRLLLTARFNRSIQ